MEYITYEQLMEKYNLSYRRIGELLKKYEIKGFTSSNKKFFIKEHTDIFSHRPPQLRPNKKYTRQNITIIEYYQKLRKCAKVSSTLNISKTITNRVVKEWMETGCVTVESKMNNEPQI